MIGRRPLTPQVMPEVLHFGQGDMVEVHYISGFLYVVTRTPDKTVVLGEKVFDEASGSERDVDIVVATAIDFGLIGVVVKDESRPSLGDLRGAVSASGMGRSHSC